MSIQTATSKAGQVKSRTVDDTGRARPTRETKGTIPGQSTAQAMTAKDRVVATVKTMCHDSETAGRHGYQLNVTTPDGTQDEVSRSRSITPGDPRAAGFVGNKTRPKHDPATPPDGTEKPEIEDPVTAEAIWGDMDKDDLFQASLDIVSPDGPSPFVSKLTLSEFPKALFGATRFGIGFDLRLLEAGRAGTILFLNGTTELVIDGQGCLILSLETSDGKVQIATPPSSLGERETHHIDIEYDGVIGEVQLVLNGVVAARGALTGMTAPATRYGLSLGHPWSDADAPALVEALDLRETGALRDAGTLRFDSATPETRGQSFSPFEYDGAEASDLSDAGAQIVYARAQAQMAARDRLAGKPPAIGNGSGIRIDQAYDVLINQDSFSFTPKM